MPERVYVLMLFPVNEFPVWRQTKFSNVIKLNGGGILLGRGHVNREVLGGINGS